jgi:putative ABC transport system permease protein
MFDALRVGLKSIVRRPMLAVAIVVPLALATAVSTALFSIADGLVYRPLPLRNVESTITVSLPASGARWTKVQNTLTDPAARMGLQEAFNQSPLFVLTLRSTSGGYFRTDIVRETGLKVAAVDIRFFDHFGLSPALGRPFSEDDQSVAASITSALDGIQPVILSDGYWRREFGADPAVVGHEATTAGRRVSIVGVMAPGVKFPGRTDIWTLRPRQWADPVSGFAQLAPGATVEQARAAFPSLDFAPLRESLRPSGAGTVVFIFGTALSLLLLAWVQIGGLVLTNASDRLREIAVRISLGAGRARILGQFAAESFWLVAVALGVSVLVTPALTNLLIDLLPDSLTAAQYLQPDVRAVLFAVVVTGVGFVLLTLAPLGFARRVAPLQLMQGRVAASLSTGQVRPGLLLAQVACTTLLLYVATLSAVSYLNVLRFDYGFDAENVVLIEPPIPPAGEFMAHEGRVAATAQRLGSVPGVRIATVITDSPLRDRHSNLRSNIVLFDGRAIEHVRSRIFAAGPEVVEALGATLIAGKGLNQPEYVGRRDIVLINEALARQVSPIVPVLGKRIRGDWLDATIVGVIKDLVDSTPERPAEPLFIQPAEVRTSVAHQILVRTSLPAEALMSTLRKAVEKDFGPMRSTQLYLLADDVDVTVAPWRGRAAVLGLVAVLGLPLAIAGIASGLFFLVRTRTRELGIRLALGATPAQARSFVLAYAQRIVAIGGVVGVGAGMLAGRAMAGQLFGVGAVSVFTTIAVSVVVGTMAWIAAYIPARRASRVDPAIVLRAE